MSYLQKRLSLSSLIEPVKDGSDASFSGKLNKEQEYFKDNIPKYRHSFELWKNYTTQSLHLTLTNIWMRCKNGCTNEGRKLAGHSAPINEEVTMKCIQSCSVEYLQVAKQHVKVIFAYLEY